MRSKKVLRNTLFALLLQATSVIAGFILPPALISGFGPAQYGLTVAIASFLSYLFLLRSGMGNVVMFSLFKPLMEHDQNKIEQILASAEHWVRNIGYISLCYMTALSVVMYYISRGGWGYVYVAGMVAAIGLGIWGRYYFDAPYQVLLAADQEAFIYTSSQILAIVANVSVVLILINAGASLYVVMLGSGLVYFAVSILLKRYVIKKYRISKNTRTLDVDLLQQRWAGIGHSVARFVRSNSDILVITLFLNLQMVTIYSLYALITAGLEMLVTSITTPVQAALGNIMAQGKQDVLHTNFLAYETVINIISIVLFSCAYVLILPFMKIYTNSLSDLNYIQPLLAALLLTTELIYCLRLPYDTIIMAAGKFEDTKIYAFAEAALNLVLSIILVFVLGLPGVIIGTAVAVLMRTIWYMRFLNQNILHLNKLHFAKRFAINILNIFLNLVILLQIINKFELDTLPEWIFGAAVITICAASVTLAVHRLFYKTELYHCIRSFRSMQTKKAS